MQLTTVWHKFLAHEIFHIQDYNVVYKHLVHETAGINTKIVSSNNSSRHKDLEKEEK